MKTESSELELFGTSPEEARYRLEEHLRYPEHTWDRFFEESPLGSHELKALVIIARGKELRMLVDVVRKLKKKEGFLPNNSGYL